MGNACLPDEWLYCKRKYWHCNFLISYVGENKQKEGGGNKLQRIGSVIYSLLVQVGFFSEFTVLDFSVRLPSNQFKESASGVLKHNSIYLWSVAMILIASTNVLHPEIGM